jgi:glycosyltransferase involved in cell wall biosynthesis
VKISLIVPVFNEEAAIPVFYREVKGFEALKEHDIEIVFINDGSKDATPDMAGKLAADDPQLRSARNSGHHMFVRQPLKLNKKQEIYFLPQ